LTIVFGITEDVHRATIWWRLRTALQAVACRTERNILAAFQLLTCQRKRGKAASATSRSRVEEFNEAANPVNPIERMKSAEFGEALRRVPPRAREPSPMRIPRPC